MCQYQQLPFKCEMIDVSISVHSIRVAMAEVGKGGIYGRRA